MQALERVYGLRTDSEAFALVKQAVDIALSDTLAEAKQFLREQVCEMGLKYWECLAIGQCFDAYMTNISTL